MKKIYLLIILIFGVSLSAQTITVTAQPDLAEWDIIYAADVEASYGSGSPLIFGYRIDAGSDTVRDMRLVVSMTATVEYLGLNQTTIFSVDATLDLLGPIYIDNRQLDLNTASDGFRDELGNEISFNTYTFDAISGDEFESLRNQVTSNLKMPDGQYVFNLNITAPGYSVDYIGFDPHKIIIIEQPANIDLIFPPLGYEFISNTYPNFEWNSTGCDDYYIRICEYNPIQHSSPADAIQSEASFPFPDDGSFVSMGNNFQLDYSAVNGRPLEVGKAYAWQVKKMCQTTGAAEESYSEIYGFTITEAGQTITPCQQQLRNVLGDSQYNILFGPNGPLEGYGECAEITLDGENMNTTDFGALLVQLMSGAYEIESITTQ
ncbi:MAG: hypothetical protein U9Q77_09075 [Candidatus Marinimicrobia bacterium]|nr:hypothetical protein [Candidatus Neomarinimicrobiota bacterium]